ncbi:MAG: hypothetical protein M9916_00980 [Crocinitomicaceae bacterium]|nr:hypothetical protein [Crocinitomicaceae bacterium]
MSKYTLFIALFLFSCSNENNGKKLFEKRIVSPNVLNLAILHSEYENIKIFPYLFNDSIIKNRGVSEIKRIITYIYDDSLNQSLNADIDNSTAYYFDKNGSVSQIVIENYYDNKSIDSELIVYQSYNSTIGFATYNFDKTNSEKNINRDYQLIYQSDNYYSFQNHATKHKLFIVPNKKHWKPLIIDTLCKPKKNDVIILGNLYSPNKIYSVDGLVKESNVRKFEYKNGQLVKCIWDDSPFTIHRVFEYNKKGICTIFRDEIYSINKLISLTKYKISFKDDLPIKIRKEIVNDKGTLLIYEEQFIYSFEQ